MEIKIKNKIKVGESPGRAADIVVYEYLRVLHDDVGAEMLYDGHDVHVEEPGREQAHDIGDHTIDQSHDVGAHGGAAHGLPCPEFELGAVQIHKDAPFRVRTAILHQKSCAGKPHGAGTNASCAHAG